MKHIVSGIFVCEVEGDTRKEVMIETYKSIRDGMAKLHIMEIQDIKTSDRRTKDDTHRI